MMDEITEAAAKAIYEKFESYPAYATRQMNNVLAEDLAEAALSELRGRVSRLTSVAEAFRLQFNPHDLPEGAFQLWESLGNEVSRIVPPNLHHPKQVSGALPDKS